MTNRPVLIGIAGGSGSGKTLIAYSLVDDLISEKVFVISQDSYYKDHSHLSMRKRMKINYDHPDAFDFHLLNKDLKNLINGNSIITPQYNYVEHKREKGGLRKGEYEIIILEGILMLYDPAIRDMLDIKAYVDADADVRFIRRLKRDLEERGRDVKSVIKQYYDTVRPMHLEFVEPTKRYADIIIPRGGRNRVAVDLFKTKILMLLKEKE